MALLKGQSSKVVQGEEFYKVFEELKNLHGHDQPDLTGQDQTDLLDMLENVNEHQKYTVTVNEKLKILHGRDQPDLTKQDQTELLDMLENVNEHQNHAYKVIEKLKNLHGQAEPKTHLLDMLKNVNGHRVNTYQKGYDELDMENIKYAPWVLQALIEFVDCRLIPSTPLEDLEVEISMRLSKGTVVQRAESIDIELRELAWDQISDKLNQVRPLQSWELKELIATNLDIPIPLLEDSYFVLLLRGTGMNLPKLFPNIYESNFLKLLQIYLATHRLIGFNSSAKAILDHLTILECDYSKSGQTLRSITHEIGLKWFLFSTSFNLAHSITVEDTVPIYTKQKQIYDAKEWKHFYHKAMKALEEVTEVHKMLPKVKGHQPNDQSTPFDNILSAIQNVTKNTETQTAITKLNKKLGELQRSNEAPKCLKALGLETLEAGPWVLQALAQYITCARRQEDRFGPLIGNIFKFHKEKGDVSTFLQKRNKEAYEVLKDIREYTGKGQSFMWIAIMPILSPAVSSILNDKYFIALSRGLGSEIINSPDIHLRILQIYYDTLQTIYQTKKDIPMLKQQILCLSGQISPADEFGPLVGNNADNNIKKKFLTVQADPFLALITYRLTHPFNDIKEHTSEWYDLYTKEFTELYKIPVVPKSYTPDEGNATCCIIL